MRDLEDPAIYRRVLETLPVGVHLADRERRIFFWNDGAERITGYLRHDVIGRFCREDILVHDGEKDAASQVRALLAETLHDGKTREVRVYVRHREGHRVPVRLIVIAVRDAHGTIIGAAEVLEEQTFAPLPEGLRSQLAECGGLDFVTGIPNHWLTQARLLEHHAGFVDHGLSYSVLGIEINELEHFREAHGCQASDAILRVVAHTVRNLLSPADFLGRWSPDEFIAVLLHSGEAALRRTAESMRKMVRLSGIRWWGDELTVSVSLGMATPSRGESLASVLERMRQSLKSPGGFNQAP
jgi:PAS domain S-box-containing protein/diguanylate cyclase (GGDEF)-like protein